MRGKTSARWCIILFLFIILGCGRKKDGESHTHEQPSETDLTAHPSDGKGWADLFPTDPVKAGDWGSWTIRYFPGPDGIDTGGGILFQVSPFWYWSTPQTYNPEGTAYTTVTSSNRDVGLNIIMGDYYYILCILEKGRLTPGDTVTIVYGDTAAGGSPNALARADRYAERDEEFLIKIDGNGDNFFTPIEESPSLDIYGREAVKIVAYAPSTVMTGERFTCRISALDGYGNRDIHFTGEVELSAGPGRLELPAKITFQPSDSGSIGINVTARSSGIQRIEVRSADSLIAARSNPVRSSRTPSEYRLFWGDLQGHSELGDGSGQPDQYYAYARDVSGLDVAALTEHDAHGFFPLDENPQLWDLIRKANESFYAPGEFVCFLAYEWTNWTFGHRHVLFPGLEGEIFSFRDSISDTPEELWELVGSYNAIVIPHHPAGGPIRVDWDHHDDMAEPLVEICSVHGSSDYYGCPNQIYRAEKGSFVRDALERGYRLGIIGSGDTHDGHPGRRSPGYPFMGLAGIWAKELTREGIWEALLAKRVYATSGERIILEFEIQGRRMGETIELEGDTPGRITVEAVGTADIESIDILEDEKILFRDEVGVSEASLQHDHLLKPGSFYRVRLTQIDGETAWSSPIWCTEKSE